jgi:hypothetical protein
VELLNKRLSKYAAYFGIVAAILALGSWITMNYFGNRANVAHDALENTESALSNSRNFRRIYGLVDEETHNLDHIYTLPRNLWLKAAEDASSRTADNTSFAQYITEQQRYDTLKWLEYTRHSDRSIQSELECADQLIEYTNILHVSDNFIQRATEI